MYIDRILYPVTSLGPGNRLAIWVAGCKAGCKGCANPELWEQHPQQYISVENFAQILKKQLAGKKIDGITVSGGEPFNQAEEIAKLIKLLDLQVDVLVFSGYLIEDIRQNEGMNELLQLIDVLIDGKYIEELNDGESCLRGSTNQRIHILNLSLADIYEEYMSKGRQIQNFIYDYKTISVGIHNNDSGHT